MCKVSYTTTEIVRWYSQVRYDQLEFENESDYDSFLHDVLIPQASRMIDQWCGHNFQSNSGTILLDGSGKEAQHINRIGRVDVGSGYEPPELLPVPMLSITAVNFNGVGKTVTDFQIYDEIVTYKNNIFDTGRQNIKIEGTWGYTTVPEDIKYVTARACANVLTEMVRSRMLPDLITPILTGEGNVGILFRSPKVLTKNEKEILNRYRFREYGVG